MAKKDFSTIRKPGDGAKINQDVKSKVLTPQAALSAVETTRKTVELPVEYFRKVKITAAKRGIKDKDIWNEIVSEYFSNHPES